MAKVAAAPMLAARRERLEGIRNNPRTALQEIEKLEARLERTETRLRKVELQVILPLPGCKLKRGSEERYEMRKKFAESCFWGHIPIDWQEDDFFAVREQDVEKAQQYALTLDNRYHEYMYEG